MPFVNKLLTETNANIHINLSNMGKHTILRDPNTQGRPISPCVAYFFWGGGGFLNNSLIYVKIEILRNRTYLIISFIL